MPIYYRYAEDPTGTSPNNLVQGEVCKLSTRAIRFAVPKYAPFYKDSMQIFDNLTQRPLMKGVDYSFPVILREATLRYGKEVCDAIMVENPDVSDELLVSYQCVGGPLQSNIDNIVQIYEAYANDNRSVDWINVLNKPTAYPPSAHPHYLSEVFGFEPVSFELERIAAAIQLGNSPAFEAIINAVLGLVISTDEIDANVAGSKLLSYDRLQYMMNQFDFNTLVMMPHTASIRNGKSQAFRLHASNVPDNQRYFWVIKHITSTPADFVSTSGIVTLTNGKGGFMLQTTFDKKKETAKTFQVELRLKSIYGPIVKTSQVMTLLAHSNVYADRILDGARIEPISSPRLRITARTYGVNQGVYNATFD